MDLYVILKKHLEIFLKLRKYCSRNQSGMSGEMFTLCTKELLMTLGGK